MRYFVLSSSRMILPRSPAALGCRLFCGGAALALAAGCGASNGADGDGIISPPLPTDSGGQLGEEANLGCEVLQEREVGVEDDVAGFSAAQVLGPIVGDTAGTFTWDDARDDLGGRGLASAQLTIERAGGSVLYRERVPPAGKEPGAYNCGRELSIPVTSRLDVEPSDGGEAVREIFELILTATSPVDASGSVPIRGFGGFELDRLEQPASLNATLSLSGANLHLQVQGSIDLPDPAPSEREDAEVQPEALPLRVGEFFGAVRSEP